MPLQLPARERQGRACDRGTSGLVRGAEAAQRRGTVKLDLPPHTHTHGRRTHGQMGGGPTWRAINRNAEIFIADRGGKKVSQMSINTLSEGNRIYVSVIM